MDKAMNRINDILKYEESLRQLSELAEMIRSGEFTGDGVEEECPKAKDVKSSVNSEDMPDMEMMLKLSSLAGAMNSNDKNTELLMALRPHLSPDGQQRLDRAVKILKLISVYEMAKESGILNNFL